MSDTLEQLETLWGASGEDSGNDDTGGEDSGGDSGDDNTEEETHTHSYTSSVTTAATCTTSGVRTYTCSCGETYTETIAGSCHQIFSKLLNAFPNAKIIVILQPVRGDGTNPGTDVDGNDTSGFDDIQFNLLQSVKKQRAVKEIAEFYGLTICDCCFDWYTTANPNHLTMIWGGDLLHLTDMGNLKLTEKLTKTLEEAFV